MSPLVNHFVMLQQGNLSLSSKWCYLITTWPAKTRWVQWLAQYTLRLLQRSVWQGITIEQFVKPKQNIYEIILKFLACRPAWHFLIHNVFRKIHQHYWFKVNVQRYIDWFASDILQRNKVCTLIWSKLGTKTFDHLKILSHHQTLF